MNNSNSSNEESSMKGNTTENVIEAAKDAGLVGSTTAAGGVVGGTVGGDSNKESSMKGNTTEKVIGAAKDAGFVGMCTAAGGVFGGTVGGLIGAAAGTAYIGVVKAMENDNNKPETTALKEETAKEK